MLEIIFIYIVYAMEQLKLSRKMYLDMLKNIKDDYECHRLYCEKYGKCDHKNNSCCGTQRDNSRNGTHYECDHHLFRCCVYTQGPVYKRYEEMEKLLSRYQQLRQNVTEMSGSIVWDK